MLLGDSIFDNAAYTRGQPAVIEHLRAMLPPPWRATLAAVDGATTADVPQQARLVPSGATHLALSVGGNDALGHVDLLYTPVTSTAAALDLFCTRLSSFESSYRRALAAVVALALPVTVCTIYNGALVDPDEARRARTALRMFNDVILRCAWENRCSILELRLICNEPADYANPIEPSGSGGGKIAQALARASGAIPVPEPALYTPHHAVV